MVGKKNLCGLQTPAISFILGLQILQIKCYSFYLGQPDLGILHMAVARQVAACIIKSWYANHESGGEVIWFKKQIGYIQCFMG